jgi:hypothetical protein
VWWWFDLPCLAATMNDRIGGAKFPGQRTATSPPAGGPLPPASLPRPLV